MNKKTAHKEFIYQLERFLQVYFNPGDVVSTSTLRKELQAQSGHPVHSAYRKFLDACNCSTYCGGYWRLYDYANRVAAGMKYCEGFFTETKRGVYQSEDLKGTPFVRRYNYVKVPGAPRVPATEISNLLLLA